MNGWSDLAVSLLSGGRRDSNDISRVRVCGLPGRCGLWRLATACATLAGPDGRVFFRSPPPPAERMAASAVWPLALRTLYVALAVSMAAAWERECDGMWTPWSPK